MIGILRIGGRTMKRGKPAILLMTVLLVAIIGVFGMEEFRNQDFPFLVVVNSDGVQEELRCVELDGEYYVFLPGYVRREQTYFRTNFLNQVYIEGKRLTEKISCEEFPLDTELEMMVLTLGYEDWRDVTFLQSGNVPTMYIDVASGSMDHIHARKGNKESGMMRLYSADGRLEDVSVVESLRGRGNSTWEWCKKKPYSMRLGQELDLLGMGKADNWVLLANAFDESQIKDKLAYDLARDAGMPYTPECQWVDLYLNGSYAGLYLLSERNEIHPERVDIPAESSVLVSWEPEHRMIDQGYPYVMTERGRSVRIHHSGIDLETVEKLWQSAENAIYAENGMDPVTGKHWQELIDLDSWAMLFLMDEIPADYDGGGNSKFFYYNASEDSGKIYAGPIWDKDDAFSTGAWELAPPNSLAASRRPGRMFTVLYEKEDFSDRVAQLYGSIFLPLLKEQNHSGIDAYTEQIRQAAYSNAIRWDMDDPEEACRIVADFLAERTEILEDYWCNDEEFCVVSVHDTCAGGIGKFLVRPGDYLPEIPMYEGCGYFLEGTDIQFDILQPITADADIVLEELSKHSLQGSSTK